MSWFTAPETDLPWMFTSELNEKIGFVLNVDSVKPAKETLPNGKEVNVLEGFMSELTNGLDDGVHTIPFWAKKEIKEAIAARFKAGKMPTELPMIFWKTKDARGYNVANFQVTG